MGELSDPKNIQALSTACGQQVNIKLRSDSAGAIGVANSEGLLRLRHMGVRFSRLQAETCREPRQSKQSARTTQRCRLKHQTYGPTFVRILLNGDGCDGDPETVS